jgi:hypothetical protein
VGGSGPGQRHPHTEGHRTRPQPSVGPTRRMPLHTRFLHCCHSTTVTFIVARTWSLRVLPPPSGIVQS